MDTYPKLLILDQKKRFDYFNSCNNKKGRNLFTDNLSLRNTIYFIQQSKYLLAWRIIKHFLLSCLIATFLIPLRYLDENKPSHAIIRCILIPIISCSISYCIISCVAKIIQLYLCYCKKNFIRYVYNMNIFTFNLIFTFLLYSLFLYIKKDDIVERMERLYFSDSCVRIVAEKIHPFLTSLITCLIIILIKNLIVDSIKYKVHKNFYKERVEQIDMIFNDLNSINKFLSISEISNVSNLCDIIFDFFKLDDEVDKSNIIRKQNFVKKLGDSLGERVYMYFDVGHDDILTYKDFCARYNFLINEKMNLYKSLDKTDESFNVLNIILLCIAIPIIIAANVFIFYGKDFYASTFGYFTSCLLAFSFIFRGTMTEMFDCVVFVYFIRPFDIGDTIIINGTSYIVDNLGLIQSSFLENNLFCLMSNISLKNQKITNLRYLEYKTESIVRKLDYIKAIEHMKLIKENIQSFLDKNKNKYQTKFYLHKYNPTGKELEITIEINILCKYQQMEIINKRRDKFIVFVDKLLSKYELNV